MVLECPLQGLDGTTVELTSRLWNSTFIEDYASLSHMDIVVRASLVLHGQAKNVILGTPDTNVSITPLRNKYKGNLLHLEKTSSFHKLFGGILLTKAESNFQFSFVWVMIPGDIDSVTRAYCCAVHWRSLVDHTGSCSSRHPDSGSAGVSALEGEDSNVTSE